MRYLLFLISLALLLSGPALLSAAPNADPFPKPASIKGLQVQMVDDALALGIHHAGININITALLDLQKKPGNPTHTVDGHEFSFNAGYLKSLDQQIKPLSDRGVLVYAIVLSYPSKNAAIDAVAIHPDDGTNPPKRPASPTTAVVEEQPPAKLQRTAEDASSSTIGATATEAVVDATDTVGAG